MKNLLLFLSAFLFFNYAHAQSIELLTPNGGESLTGCTDVTISWNTQGNVSPYVNLYYSVDAGQNWRNIRSNYFSPNSGGSVTWSVAKVNSNTVKIKIEDSNNAAVKDSSDLNFSITSNVSTNTLTITSPNGGESFSPATLQTISWNNSGTVGNVSIDYSVDGGRKWNFASSNSIASAINIPNTGTFNWLIPSDAGIVSSKALIRVYESSKSCNIDYSDAFFTINNNPTITLLTPSNNTTLYAGRYQMVSWRSFNIPGDKVKIDYSIDNGTNWIVLEDSLSTNMGFGISWIVPNTVTNQGLMRVSASRNNAIQSVGTFKIVKPYLLLNRPNGGEVLSGCNNASISWTQLGIADTVYVDYSLDGGTTWNNNAVNKFSNKNGADSVAFSIPNVSTNAARFRIHENTNQLVPSRDSSDANVTINADASRAITLTYPNGGESIPVNSVQRVTWTSKGAVGNVNIQYSFDNGASWIWMYTFTGESSKNIPNTGSFNWVLYSFPSLTDKIKIRIYESANPCIIDWTDNVFGLHNDPHVSIVKPIDGDSLFTGGPYAIGIQWLSTNVFNVDIDYSIDNGTTWNVLFDSIYSSNGGNNARPWNVPNTITDNGVLRIRSATTPSIENKIKFKIVHPILRLNAPAGGETFTNCTNANISWYQKAASPNIMLEYSLDEGINWIVITTKADGKNGLNNYSWSVPNIATSKLRVRISDPNNNQVKDSTKTNMTIIPDTTIGIHLISPNGGEVFQPGTVQTVKWVSKGLLQYITLEYSTDQGKNWNLMYDTQGNSSNYLSDNGSFDWLLAGNAIFSDKCLVRISHFGRTCTQDYSDAYFSVNNNPVITILDPTPNDTLYTGVSCYEIKWSHYNIPGDQVSLDYSLDNGAHWNVIIDSTLSKPIGNAFRWTVPTSVTNQGKLRIAAARNKSIKTEASFRIDTTYVKLLYPAGGEVFTNCTDANIVWENHGEPGNVNIDYSLDEGKTWMRHVGVARKNGKDSIGWQPPNVATDKVRIRMVGECNPAIGDSMKTNCTIHKDPLLGLQIIYPNGGETFSLNTFHTITWETKGNIDRVSLLYTDNNGRNWSYLSNSKTGLSSYNIANTGSYSWQVPWWISDLNKIQLKIYAIGNECLDDYTDSLINLDRNPSVAIVKPEQSETLRTGQAYDIQWTTFAFPNTSVGYVHIEYSLDNGSNWISFEDSTYAAPPPSVNTFKWIVPNAVTNQGILRIHYSRNKAYKDEINFKIISPYVNIINPTGNETWFQGESNIISWNASGLDSTSLLKIDYSIDSAQTWNAIASVKSTQSSYNWTIPDTVSSQCYIKISSPDFPLCKDSNKVAFEILKKFKVIEPQAGDIWHMGDSRNIKWNSDRSRGPGTVKIEYSLNNGTTWNTIIASTPNAGTYSWKLSSSLTPSANCLVRVKGLPPSNVYNISDIFEITGPVITNTQSIETNGSWVIYPNPTQDVIKISGNVVSGETVHVRLLNGAGQVILDQSDRATNGVYTKTINMNEEKSGIYILQIITNKEVINRKVTKN